LLIKRVLITGAGAPGGPGIIKALQLSGKLNLVVADADAYAAGRFLNKEFELIPKAEDENFIDEIKRICKKHKIEIIFPLVTKELFHFAKHKKEFLDAGIKIIVSDDELLQIANDKGKLYRHLHEHKIIVPEFYLVHTIDEFKEAAKQLGYPGKEFCFKPSVSNGSRGFRIVSDKMDEFDLLFNHKPNATYMRYEKAIEILSSKPFPELLLTEYLPGEEYTIDTIIKNGEPQIILPRRRTQMREGISIKGEFVKQEEILKYCNQIIHSMKLHGPIGIQVKKATDGTFKILEINPRIQGTSVAAMGMNINLPLIAVLQEFDMEKELIPKEIKWGTKFTRYYQEAFY
jgi:carbamoyl-phosphate synthase large subunit